MAPIKEKDTLIQGKWYRCKLPYRFLQSPDLKSNVLTHINKDDLVMFLESQKGTYPKKWSGAGFTFVKLGFQDMFGFVAVFRGVPLRAWSEFFEEVSLG